MEPTLQEKYGFDTILQLISGVVTVIVLGVPMVHKARLLLRRRRLRRARRFEETSQVNNDLTGTLLLALRTLVWYYRVEEERLLTTALPSTAGAFLTGGLLAKLLKTLAPLHEIVLQLEQIERSLTASQGTWSALLRDYGMLAEERLQASDSDVPGTFARPRSPALADGGTRSCVICMQHQRTHTYLPCMHRCVCAECADRWAAACPLCRESATGCARVYD